ncbi:hypothetical protein AAVH_14673 [Aphelenchoides avenae]|nr:hypothetical protein AAVH_14673 [Aphelenchus avenae]
MSKPALQHSLMRALHIYNEFCNNQIVTEDRQSRTTLYHINNQLTFLSDRPDVIVHRGDSRPVGFCRLNHCLFSACKLECYVDSACSQLLTVVQRTGAFSGTFEFELLRSDGVPRYAWENTTPLNIGRSYELVDEQRRVLAFFDNATFSMSKCGTLYVQSDLNECFLDIIILTLAILLEARRREAGSKHRC